MIPRYRVLDPKGPMPRLLVIRFGSLGDLCVLGWSLARLADRPQGQAPRVTLATKAAWAELAGQFHGVDEVVPLEEGGVRRVAQMAASLRRTPFDAVIDAHNILRSHLTCGLLGRRPEARLAKDTTARLAFMRLGHRDTRLDFTMRDRFDALFTPWAPAEAESPGTPPLLSLAPTVAGPRPLGLAPGAQWDTKRWPDNKFATLLEEHLQRDPGQVRIFLGPREALWYPGSALARAASRSDRVEVIEGRSLVDVARLIAACRALVTNDSGLLHMAEATGTPVVAFFGPTVREFGYFPQLPASRVLEVPLECRPCSRNGKRPCHRGDLACLERITPADAFAALATLEEPK